MEDGTIRGATGSDGEDASAGRSAGELGGLEAGGSALGERFLEALYFAAVRHRAQRRKGRDGAPYVNHLIQVALLLRRHGCTSEDLLCAAVLHDSIEDAGVSFEEVEERFGGAVARLVLEVTDDARLPLHMRKMRQITTVHLLTEAAQNLRVSDKISNLHGLLTSPPERWSIERKFAYFHWAKAVVDGCEKARPGLRQTFAEVYETGLASLELLRERSADGRTI
jgi:guanosine-3',5'-bis(diphosphate) 3'-pyrophosphohydrolase